MFRKTASFSKMLGGENISVEYPSMKKQQWLLMIVCTGKSASINTRKLYKIVVLKKREKKASESGGITLSVN